MKTEFLHIRVTEAAETHIELTFCASLTEHLPRLFPKTIHEKLKRGAIDLAKVAALAQENGYVPGDLFCFEDGPKLLRAWLE